MFFKRKIKCISYFLLLSLAIINAKCISGFESNSEPSKAEDGINRTSEDDSGLWLEVDVLETGVKLIDSSETETISDEWDYEKPYTIRITTHFPEAMSRRELKINLPLGMKLQSTPESIVDNKTIMNVNKDNFNDFSIQSSDSYIHKPAIGELIYEVNPGVSELTIDLLVKIDEVLWTGIKKARATRENDIALKVSIETDTEQKEVKLDEVFVVGNGWLPYNSLYGTPSNVIEGERGSITYSVSANNSSGVYSKLYKKVITWFEIPKVTIDNEVFRAKIKQLNINSNGNYKVIGDYVLVEWDNVYFHNVLYVLNYVFEIDSPDFSNKVAATHETGGVYVQSYFDDEIVKVTDERHYSVPYVSPVGLEDYAVSGTNKNVFKDENLNDYGQVTNGGRFNLFNYAEATKAKRINFSFPSGEGAGVGVKVVNLFLPSNKGNVKYTLWKEGSEEEITGSLDVGNYILSVKTIFSSLDREDYADWYIKDIEYILDSIPSKYSKNALNHGVEGNFFVRPLDGGMDGAQYSSRMTITTLDENNEPKKSIGAEAKTILQTTGSTTMAIRSHKIVNDLNENIRAITAGDAFRIKGEVFAVDYPYLNTVFSSSPALILRMPKGVNLDLERSSGTLKRDGKTYTLGVDVAEKEYDSETGMNTYKIKFTHDEIVPGVGFHNEDLSSVSTLNFDLRFTTQRNTKTMGINMNEFIFLIDENVEDTTCGGSWSTYCVTDIWDLDKDGSRTDSIPTINEKLLFNIEANGDWLETNLEVAINDKKYSSIGATITNEEDIVNVKLSVNNENEGTTSAGEFIYYIPVPKKDINYPTQVKNDSERFDFDLILTEFLDEVDGFEILYSTDNNSFVSASMISNIEEVSMIKISSTADINHGDYYEFIAKMKYKVGSIINSGNDGNDVAWSAYGYQSYTKNGMTSKINHVFEKNKIDLIFKPSILKQPTSQVAREGECVSFSVDVFGIPSGKGYWEYRVSDSEDWIKTSITEHEISLDNINRNQNGYEYRYVVTNDGGQTISETAILTVYSYGVTIPKKINGNVIGESEGLLNYEIKITGNLSENDKISIIPISEDVNSRLFFLLDEKGREGVVIGRVVQEETEVFGYEVTSLIPKIIRGQIELPMLPAGIWTGRFDFYIRLNN